MQAVVKDLVKRGGIRALEAFGDTRAAGHGRRGRLETASCVLPADYLLRVGFRPTGRTRATPGCGSSCARRSPGATRWRARWSGCSAPYARCGTRPPDRASADGAHAGAPQRRSV